MDEASDLDSTSRGDISRGCASHASVMGSPQFLRGPVQSNPILGTMPRTGAPLVISLQCSDFGQSTILCRWFVTHLLCASHQRICNANSQALNCEWMQEQVTRCEVSTSQCSSRRWEEPSSACFASHLMRNRQISLQEFVCWLALDW